MNGRISPLQRFKPALIAIGILIGIAVYVGSVSAQQLDSHTTQAGAVTIKATPLLTADLLSFVIVLDTHSLSLDDYDLGQLAVARTDDGQEVLPDVWEAPRGAPSRRNAGIPTG